MPRKEVAMNNRFCSIALALFPLLLGSCGDILSPEKSVSESSEADSGMEDTMRELITDRNFETGFDLMTTSTENGRTVSRTLDYGGEAKKTETRPWKMAQWWTPFDFANAPMQKTDAGSYIYENESRVLEVNPKKGSIMLQLNSYKEYMEKFGHSRVGTENWSHFLIEQDFVDAPKLTDLKHVYVHLKFRIFPNNDLDPDQAIPCSQITWYFTITDVRNGDTGYQSGNNDNDFFWFGLPIFDSRYPFLSPYQHVDSGFVGATNRLIYSLGSDTYFDTPVQVGEERILELDILPYIKQAYLYGFDHGAMQNSSWDRLVLNYMNLGWELPGSFESGITISELSVRIERRDAK